MAETDKYKVPTNAVKVPDDDTGYKMVKKAYNRFIWTWNQAPDNSDDYKIDEHTTGDNAWGNINLQEVPGMGRSDSDWIPGGVTGYRSGPMSKNVNILTTDEYMDPDKKKKKMRKIKTFKDFK